VTRFSFFAGKGGVGKTTCAAAAALALSRRARTLLVSTDPAHSLGDALSLRLSAAPRVVRGRLFAAEMDADRALSRWLGARERAFREIASRGTYLDDEDIDSLFQLSLPGVDELVALIELERLAAGFEQVVVDTAPTGHTLRLLQMPETLGHLAKVLDDLQAKHRALAQSLRGTVRRDAEDAVIDELSARASALHALVRSSAAEFHWVMLADQLSLLETQDGIGTLRAAGIRVAELIANRLTPPPDRRCGLCDARRAEEARVLSEVRQLGVPIATVADQGAEPRGLRALGRIAAQRSRSLGHLTKSAKPPRRSSLESHWGHEGAPSGAAIMSPTFSAPLGHLTKEIAPAGTRLLFFGGKGGVGKTTAAATAGLALAERGQRVLLLSTDPAHSLGDALRMEIGDKEREVAPRLRARELDAAQAFRARRDRYRAAVDQLFETLRGGSSFDAPYDRLVMQDLIELAPPGLDELFGLLAVIDALRREEVVVVDTAPTGHALRMEIGDDEREVAPRLRARELDAAQAFRARRDRYRAAVDQLFEALRGGSSFDAPYDRLVMQDLIELAPPGLDELFGLLAVIDALRREEVVVVDTAPTGHALRLLELVSTAREWVQVLLQILLKYRRVTGLGQLAKDLTDTARELREFEELLHDPLRARFVAVTRAAALPRLETTRLLKALKRLRVAAPAVLVNALTPPGCSRCKRAGRDEARELTLLRKARRGWAMLGAPAVAPGPRGLDELREFGRTWTRIE